jgi:hypothetical protein
VLDESLERQLALACDPASGTSDCSRASASAAFWASSTTRSILCIVSRVNCLASPINRARVVPATRPRVVLSGPCPPALPRLQPRRPLPAVGSCRAAVAGSLRAGALLLHLVDMLGRRCPGGLPRSSGARLEAAVWLTRREIIRTLVSRVEIDHTQVNVVFRVPPDPFVASSDSLDRGVLPLCRRGARPLLRCPSKRPTLAA